jgi:hypothetical protein
MGCDIAIDDIWCDVAMTDQYGNQATAPHRLARHSLSNDFDALAFQAHLPWSVLQTVLARRFQVIVCHRLRHGSHAGHFSHVVSADDSSITLWDCAAGRKNCYQRLDFLRLWTHASEVDEFRSGMMVVIAARQPDAEREPVTTLCRRCGQVISLRLLYRADAQWLNQNRVRRPWRAFFCHQCDAALG